MEKSAEKERRNDDVEHSGSGLVLIAKVIQIVIDANNGIFKVCAVAGLKVIPFAKSLKDKQTFPKGN